LKAEPQQHDSEGKKSKRPLSPTRLRLRRFRRIRRGYYAFVILMTAYVLSFFLPFLMSDRALFVKHEGNWYSPAVRNYFSDTFGKVPLIRALPICNEKAYFARDFGELDEDGNPVSGLANFRRLKEQFAEGESGNFVLLPPIPYGPNESLLKELSGAPPHGPSGKHWLGTDDRARDVLVRLAYGFRVSVTFALFVTILSYIFGTFAGCLLGYFGRWVDLVGLRLVEIWGAIPFLYMVLILADLFGRTFFMLAGILTSFGWLGITYYIRGEFYREKAKDYVAAAIATGEGHVTIMLRHILPNALTPIITFFPFAMVIQIVSLVSLDFLGYGLPAPTPSWGEMLRQAKQNLQVWHLVVFPLGAMFLTLQLIVFIGEAVREAFDPKVLSRLR